MSASESSSSLSSELESSSSSSSSHVGPLVLCSMYIEELKEHDDISVVSDACPHCGLPGFRHGRKPIVNETITYNNPPAVASNIFRDVVKTLPKWKANESSSSHFLKRTAQILTAGNIPQTEWTRLLLLQIDDTNESDWVQNNIISKDLDWDDAIPIFAGHFDVFNVKDKLESDYESCRQYSKTKETVQHYSDRFLALCSELNIKDDDNRCITHFINGLSYHIKNKLKEQVNFSKVLGNPIVLTSLKTVCEMAIAIELTIIPSTNHGHDKPGSSPSNNNNYSHGNNNSNNHKNNNKNKPSGDKKTCINHPNSTSHTTAQCFMTKNGGSKSPAKPTSSDSSNKSSSSSSSSNNIRRCFKCGSPDHLSNDKSCPKYNQPKSTNPSTNPSSRSVTRSVDVVPAPTVSMLSVSTIDRSLPVSLFETPQSSCVNFIIDKDTYCSTLLDTGADVSFIDSSLVTRLNLSVTPADGIVNLAHINIKAPRVGTCVLTFTAVFPGTDMSPVVKEHVFEVLPLYAPDQQKDYHFILGTDLIHELFPNGIPLSFVPKPAIPLQTRTSSLVVGSPVFLDDIGDVNDVGVGSVPDSELPSRVVLSTPSDLLSEYSINRSLILNRLHAVLTINENLTGFCNLPESVMSLTPDPSQLHRLYRRQYPVAQKLWSRVDEVIQRWLSSGRIDYAPRDCRYNSPLVVAPKKDENGAMTGIRVCLDTRVLNSMLLDNDRFPIPNIRDALDVFSGNKIFGEFDLSEAFLQFRLHPDSQQYTAFTWKGMQYVFIGVPFGINKVPSHFQRVITHIFKDLPFTHPYIDNLPFGSKSWEDHHDHSLCIIVRCNNVNLRIKPSSVNLGHAQIKCLGSILSALGISVDPDKMKSIYEWPQPLTGDQLQTFLGMISFIRGHIRNCAELTGPLEAIKYSKIIEWTPLLVEHFNSVKSAILKTPLLKFPNYTLPFHVATDASRTGIGGVLYQPHAVDEHITADNIVAMYSRKLTSSQQRWPAYKLELYAVVTSLRYFHSYIWGRDDLVIITDHKPLTYMLSSVTLSPALQQWLDVILDYHFEIKHRPGILHVLPDQLSRMYSTYYNGPIWGIPPDNASLIDIVGESPTDIITESFPQNIKASPLSLQGKEEVSTSDSSTVASPPDLSIFDESDDESDLASTQDVLPSDNNPADPVEIKSESNIANSQSKLEIELEKRGMRSLSTLSERVDMVKKYHLFGHFGREAIFKKLWHDNYWWPNMRQDIQEELKNCDACVRYVVTKTGYHPFTFITADGPWTHLQIDCSVHLPESSDGYTTLFVIIDVFTGFVILRPVKNSTGDTIARELWNIFCIMGLPKIIQSDNGPEFVNQVIRSFIKITGIDHRLITPYNPRADGKVERAIGSVMLVIKKLLHGANQNWPLFAPFAQLSFNNKVASLTGSTPFSLMFGRSLIELIDYTKKSDPKLISYEDWKIHQEKILSLIYPAISERIKSNKTKLIETMNQHRRLLLPNALPTGSTVMLVDQTRTNKFEPKYVGDVGSYEYLIEWKGYTEKTWEPETNILDDLVVKKYWKSLKKSDGQ